jgi:hypothetical protein
MTSQQVTTQSTKKLAQIVCILSMIILAMLSAHNYIKHNEEERNAHYLRVQAIEENKVELCGDITNFKFAAQCYDMFIEEGYKCGEKITTETSDRCLFAEAVEGKDDEICDAYFQDNVPLQLECRVSVFIERYTNEGLSDCCHME